MFKSKTNQLILLFCIVHLVLHLIADSSSGFSGDELLHIQTGNHPDIGYMEFPPVIGWLAFLQNQLGSSAVFVHHIFVHIASLLILIFSAAITIQLGGKTKAVFFVLLCLLISPGFGRTQQLFQPVVFSELCWVLGFYQLIRFIKKPDHRHLLYLTLTLAFGFLTKYDIVFLMAGLAGLFFFKKTSTFLFRITTVPYILLFLAIISPNVWWQYQHNFPMFQMFSRLYETQLDKLTFTDVISRLVIALNPLTLFIWLGGAIFMFNKKDKEIFRPVAVTVTLSILLLAIGKSKDYYFFSPVIMLIVFGSIWLEKKVFCFRKWLFYPVTIVLMLSGILLIPWGIKVLPLQTFIATYHIKEKDGITPVHFGEYYSNLLWDNTLTAISKVYDSLPANEQRNCLIWGKHYRQAGVAILYQNKYHLPAAFSYHGSFYTWAPAGKMPATIIAFSNGEAGIDFFQPYFDSVIAVATVHNPYAETEKDTWQTIYVCKNPRQDFATMNINFKERIFE